MSNRLETIISYVDEGIGVADVGTDHAYLPLMLVKRGYKGNIIATDINEGPLNKALVNLRESYAEDKVKLILCDGLSGCDPDDIDTVVIAGMGGDTITGILDRTPWCDREGIKLVLQPVTKSEILRYWLINNGFIITDESLCEENTTVYQILCAKAGKPCRYSDSEIFVGKFEQIKDSEYFNKHIDAHIKRFESAVIGLKKTRRNGLDAWLEINEGILNELKAMRCENDKC